MWICFGVLITLFEFIPAPAYLFSGFAFTWPSDWSGLCFTFFDGGAAWRIRRGSYVRLLSNRAEARPLQSA
jgi:hypothetical protein